MQSVDKIIVGIVAFYLLPQKNIDTGFCKTTIKIKKKCTQIVAKVVLKST